MEDDEPVSAAELTEVLSAVVLAAMRPLDDAQRERFHNDLHTVAHAMAESGQVRTARLIEKLQRAAQIARKTLGNMERGPGH